MNSLFNKYKRRRSKASKNGCQPEQGAAMAIVLVASAIAATTTIAVAMRSYNSYVNGTRQSLANRAKEAAEAGLNILVESLNQDHPEWLIEPYDGDGSWSISREATGGCRSSVGSNPTIEGTSNTYSNGTEGKYKLAKYSFEGNNFYGGIGSFEMEGEIRSSNNKLLASAKVYQDMSIIAKACDALPGDTSDQQDSLWPGIYMKSKIHRYGKAKTIIKGTEPEQAAKIICEVKDCENSVWESDFPKGPTTGDIETPNAQDPPEDLKGITTRDFARKVRAKTRSCKNFRIPEDLPKSSYKKDSDGTFHVYISGTSTDRIVWLEGRSTGSRKSQCKSDNDDAIKITGEGPVRLYVDSSLGIKSSTWIDTSSIKHAADFMVLGTSKSKNQKLEINGEWPEGKVFKHFIWMPEAEVKFMRANEKLRLEGSIWAKSMARATHSRLDDFELAVPQDMPQLIYQRLGKEFGIGQRDYVAQGVTSWRSYGRTPD